jgi:hypothetical protein
MLSYIALTVVCGLGKSRLISGVYAEQCERRLPLFDGFKARQHPMSTNYRYAAFLIGDNIKVKLKASWYGSTSLLFFSVSMIGV